MPQLPIDRLTPACETPPEHPRAIYTKNGGAFALTCVNAAARRVGLQAEMPLSDARAIHPKTEFITEDPDADARFLHSIARWCERFTPVVVLDPPHGLFLDITGCTHLFHGERRFLAAFLNSFSRRNIHARAAIAPTPGAAWALAHFSRDTRIVDATTLDAALAPLPVAALRLCDDADAFLRRLGLKQIGQVAHAPRAPFAARAGKDALLRLDQAYGRAVEPLAPLRPPPPITAFRRLAEPVLTLDGILIVTEALCGDLVTQCDVRAVGALRLRLRLYGLDARTRTVWLGLSRPERDIVAIMRLFKDRLSRVAENFDALFGFEALRLDAMEVAPISEADGDLEDRTRQDRIGEARLVDAFMVRLGPDHVGRPHFGDAHAPERAGSWRPVTLPAVAPAPPGDGVMRRPLTLFTPAQPIEAIAEVPDAPPRRFQWRRISHDIVRAEGPERIAPRWLKASDARTRDYYRVEDAHGRRYWIYREGLYDGAAAPRWFLHGLFA